MPALRNVPLGNTYHLMIDDRDHAAISAALISKGESKTCTNVEPGQKIKPQGLF